MSGLYTPHRKGDEIARELGPEVFYVGVQRDRAGRIYSYLFWDKVTGGFSAPCLNLCEVRERLRQVRVLWGKEKETKERAGIKKLVPGFA